MAYKLFDLSGKTALITGGNGGIGLGMAEALAQAGASVCIWGTNAEKTPLRWRQILHRDDHRGMETRDPRQPRHQRPAERAAHGHQRAGDSPDPGDEYLIAMALAAGADYLVTGDQPLLALRRIAVTRFVSPRRFSAILAR